MNIAWNLGNSDWLACLLVSGIERERGLFAWASRSKTTVKSAKTILPTRPLCKRKLARFAPVRGLANVSTVLFVVEPLVGVRTRVGLAVNVTNSETGVWIDWLSRGAHLITAELKFAKNMVPRVLQRSTNRCWNSHREGPFRL